MLIEADLFHAAIDAFVDISFRQIYYADAITPFAIDSDDIAFHYFFD